MDVSMDISFVRVDLPLAVSTRGLGLLLVQNKSRRCPCTRPWSDRLAYGHVHLSSPAAVRPVQLLHLGRSPRTSLALSQPALRTDVLSASPRATRRRRRLHLAESTPVSIKPISPRTRLINESTKQLQLAAAKTSNHVTASSSSRPTIHSLQTT